MSRRAKVTRIKGAPDDPVYDAKREADRMRASGQRIPMIDDWKCYRCKEHKRATDDYDQVDTPAGWTVRVCKPECEPFEKLEITL